MESNNQSDSMKLVGALVVGIALGAGLGLLFAPNKGSVTRANLVNKGQELSKKARRKLEDLNDQAHKKANDVADSLKDEVASAKAKMS